ncbi:MAG: tyrosine-type recombinase/integrase [Bacteroidetes bacterium]|nr:tyrosine-type recombinase/integrase [Bacteroidota bacterium]
MVKSNPFEFRLDTYKSEPIIWIEFEKDAALQRQIEKIKLAKFSKSAGKWYVPDTKAMRAKLGLQISELDTKIFEKVHVNNHTALRNFVKVLQLKGYKGNTVKVYKNEFVVLLELLGSHPVDKLNAEKLKSYFYYCTAVLKCSENHLHNKINALRLYFDQVLEKRKIFQEIPRPKKKLAKEKQLSHGDIDKIFEKSSNVKHDLVMRLCYELGIKISELVGIKLKQVELSKKKMLVPGLSGKPDREQELPNAIYKIIGQYLKEYAPKKYLFEGEGGKQYSVRSAQAVVKSLMGKAKIKKEVGVHGIRPKNYTELLLEYGTDPNLFLDLMDR